MIVDLGLIDYEKAYIAQKEFVRHRKSGEVGDSVIFAEHYPVFTIGRRGKKTNLLVDEDVLAGNGIKVLHVDRGGDITFHGPGQLVVYPIIDLKDHGRDLHRYLRILEEAVIGTLECYSVRGERLEGRTGVWVSGRKVASIGIAATDWITYHGVSLNINVGLEFFSMIYPCGMRDVSATSLRRILGRDIDMFDVKQKVLSGLKILLDLRTDAFTCERYAALA